jgi:hypothetical protein
VAGASDPRRSVDCTEPADPVVNVFQFQFRPDSDLPELRVRTHQARTRRGEAVRRLCRRCSNGHIVRRIRGRRIAPPRSGLESKGRRHSHHRQPAKGRGTVSPRQYVAGCQGRRRRPAARCRDSFHSCCRTFNTATSAFTTTCAPTISPAPADSSGKATSSMKSAASPSQGVARGAVRQRSAVLPDEPVRGSTCGETRAALDGTMHRSRPFTKAARSERLNPCSYQRVPDAPLRATPRTLGAFGFNSPHDFPDAVGEIVNFAKELWMCRRTHGARISRACPRRPRESWKTTVFPACCAERPRAELRFDDSADRYSRRRRVASDTVLSTVVVESNPKLFQVGNRVAYGAAGSRPDL